MEMADENEEQLSWRDEGCVVLMKWLFSDGSARCLALPLPEEIVSGFQTARQDASPYHCPKKSCQVGRTVHGEPQE